MFTIGLLYCNSKPIVNIITDPAIVLSKQDLNYCLLEEHYTKRTQTCWEKVYSASCDSLNVDCL